MGFEVIQSPLKPYWHLVDTDSGGVETVYVGQLVVAGVAPAASGGVKTWNIAGAADTTADQVPYGVVVGTNNRTPLYNSTYKTDYITAANTQALQVARDWVGHEGVMHPKTDPAAMVQVVKITPETVLKGRIFNASYGTAITEAVVTAVHATAGLGFTCGTTGFDFTSVGYNATMFCRSGLNKGLYRTTYSAASGTSEHLFYIYWPYTPAVGDKFVGANLSMCGCCTINFDDTGQFINGAAAVTTTDYIYVDVLELNLEKSGQEYAVFCLNPLQLLGVRAA